MDLFTCARRSVRLDHPARVSAIASALALTFVAAPSARAESADDAASSAELAERALVRGAIVGAGGTGRVDGRRGLARIAAGHDRATDRVVFDSTAEVTLADRVAVRAGAASGSEGVQPIFAAQLDALRQERFGIDLSVAAGYEYAGFNTVPAVFTRVGVSRSLGDGRIGTSASFAAGLEEGEYAGELRVGGLYRIAAGLYGGLEGRFGIDLERDEMEPEGEPDWQLRAGPVLAYSFGRYVVTGSGGVSAMRYRLQSTTRHGAIWTLGVGSAF